MFLPVTYLYYSKLLYVCNKMNNERVNVKLTVKGTVQSVNYRRTVMRYAQEYDIVGEIKNNEDMTVTILAEGNKDKIKKFIEKIEIKPKISLEEIEERKKKDEIIQPQPLINVKEIVGKYEFKPATGKFDKKGFKIKFGHYKEEMMKGISSGSYQIGTLSDITGHDFYVLGKKYENISKSALALNQNFGILNRNFKYLLLLAFVFGILTLVFIYFQ